MLFKDQNHKEFYYQYINQCSIIDTYHKSLIYTFGIDKDCRFHIDDLFNFKNNQIRINGLNKGWQTSGSYKATLLAFNLWNGYTHEDNNVESTPYEIFACEHGQYFIEAIKIRYPEYLRTAEIQQSR